MKAGIFHSHFSHFPLLVSLGFDYVEVAKDVCRNGFEAMNTDILFAHSKGLNVFVDAGFFKDSESAKYFLLESKIHDEDLICLYDEPNLAYQGHPMVEALDIRILNNEIKKLFPKNKTMITLSSIRNLSEYANTTDIIAVDYYGRAMDVFRVAKLAWRVSHLKAEHDGEVWGIAPLRYSPQEMKRHKKLWNFLGVENFLWYAFTTGEEKWFDKNLDGLPAMQEALKEINGG